MSVLYVANCTKQVHEFAYKRDKNSAQILRIPVPIGGQIQVPGITNAEQITYVIESHAAYGAVMVDELDRVKGFVSLIFSVDRAILASRIERVLEKNEFYQIVQGKNIRKEAAIANNNILENMLKESGLQEKLDTTEFSIVEDNHDDRSPNEPIAEGVRVSAHYNPDGSRKDEAPRRRNSRRG
jgi:hypothetical protein